MRHQLCRPAAPSAILAVYARSIGYDLQSLHWLTRITEARLRRILDGVDMRGYEVELACCAFPEIAERMRQARKECKAWDQEEER